MKLLLYCTKSKNKYDRLVSDEHYGEPFYLYGAITENFESLNGKVVAECDFEVEWCDTSWCCGDFIEHKGLEKSCLTKEQLFDYVKGRNEFYVIHIKNLHIFDEPKELSDYYSEYYVNGIGFTEVKLRTAPQNMRYCYNVCNHKYILISIQPQWLCKILNGEKTIEVRKKVLKEMLG